jgi:hypothetical protein
MAMLRPPFKAETPDKLFKTIMIGEYEKISAPFSKELCKFVSMLMTHNQKKRPDIKELLCYPKMMELKDIFEREEKTDNRLIETIKFPQNLKLLN